MTMIKKKKKAIVMWFGRANPITASHVIGFYTVLRKAAEFSCDYVIYLSNTRTRDTLKAIERSAKLNNPLSAKSKLKYCKKAVPEAKFTLASKKNKTNSLYEAIGANANKYEIVYIVAGPDRVETIEEAKKYFASSCIIEHIKCQGRLFNDLDSGDIIDIRATGLREAIYSLDFGTAESYMPLNLSIEDKWALYYDVLVEAGRLKGYDEFMTQKILPK